MNATCQNMEAIPFSPPPLMWSAEQSETISRARRYWSIAAVFVAVILIATLLRRLPADEVETRNILHHLNFVPLILAGMFGWRMALAVTTFAFLAEAFNFQQALLSSTFDAVDLATELAIFGIASIVAGVLSDRSRLQRQRLEQSTSELSRVYQELSQNIEQLKKAERLHAAGQLSASLAHEIRNPLASISGAAGLLKRSYMASASETNGTSEECLEILEKESQRLNKLLTNFLEFARPRAPRFQAAEIGEIVQSVIAVAGHSGDHRVELRRNLRRDLPMIECDPEQLKQVLLNLIMNAIQASSAGGVVEVSATTENGTLAISIRDNGNGLSPEKSAQILSHMFEPFFTTKEKGTGLGLAISAKIVEQHHGKLQGRTNPDGGMTFRVELPWLQQPTDSAPQAIREVVR